MVMSYVKKLIETSVKRILLNRQYVVKPPGAVLTTINQSFITEISQGDPEIYLTLFLGRPGHGEAHLRVLLRGHARAAARPHGRHALRALRAVGFPHRPRGRTTSTRPPAASSPPGDAFLFVSDGVIEARKGETMLRHGPAHGRKRRASRRTRGAWTRMPWSAACASSWASEPPQDDMCLLSIVFGRQEDRADDRREPKRGSEQRASLRLEIFTPPALSRRQGGPDSRVAPQSVLRRRPRLPGSWTSVLLQGISSLAPDIAVRGVSVMPWRRRCSRDDHAAERAFAGEWDYLVEVTARPGVTDPVALTAREALGVCLPGGVPREAIIQTAVQYLVATAPGASVDPGRACAVLPQPPGPVRGVHHPRAVGRRVDGPRRGIPTRRGEPARPSPSSTWRGSPTASSPTSPGKGSLPSRWTR